LFIRLEQTETDTVVVLAELWVRVVSGPEMVAVLVVGTVLVTCEPDDVSTGNDSQCGNVVPGTVTVSVIVVITDDEPEMVLVVTAVDPVIVFSGRVTVSGTVTVESPMVVGTIEVSVTVVVGTMV
jgi:hypothetical protein